MCWRVSRARSAWHHVWVTSATARKVLGWSESWVKLQITELIVLKSSYGKYLSNDSGRPELRVPNKSLSKCVFRPVLKLLPPDPTITHNAVVSSSNLHIPDVLLRVTDTEHRVQPFPKIPLPEETVTFLTHNSSMV